MVQNRTDLGDGSCKVAGYRVVTEGPPVLETLLLAPDTRVSVLPYDPHHHALY